MFSATSKSLFFIQILSFFLILLGFYIVDFTISYFLVSILFFYLYSIIGISMMLHRYYSHKNFYLNPIIKWIFTLFAILAGRGSVLGWVYVHRIHHATSDTEKDPHSPHFTNFKFFRFKPNLSNKKINHFIIKDLLIRPHILIDRYYLLIIFLFLLLLGLINVNLIFYVWALPVFAVSITQICFNYFAHKHGYRNFETKDRSTNNIYLWPFILGDAWHNNHHHNPGINSTKIKWWEFDPIAIFTKK